MALSAWRNDPWAAATDFPEFWNSKIRSPFASISGTNLSAFHLDEGQAGGGGKNESRDWAGGQIGSGLERTVAARARSHVLHDVETPILMGSSSLDRGGLSE